ncbi:unnamed protein product [Cyclocybe aegerita]|uniref:Uncharacterized protein n=1 Tax=Cyclocybe aegerita TaxID=1973307 RepID=A0A8S0VSQ7_CYCAE|nr:unnamed protein product [Cyclocybe aegerita]
MTPSFPQELKEQIVDTLWNDRATLKSCSLISRTFTPPCQRHLFSKIILQSPRKTDVRWPLEGGSSRNFERLLNVAPHIAEYVACLEIFNPFAGDKPWIVEESTLVSCLLHLKHLKALVLNYDPYWESLPEQLRSCLKDAMQLKSLVYVEFFCPPPPALKFGPNVRHIALLKTYIADPDSFPGMVAQNDTPLLLTSFSVWCPFAIHDFMSGTTVFSKLTKLVVDLSLIRLESHGNVWPLIRACAVLLEEFVFSPCPALTKDLNVTGAGEIIDPSILTSLQRLLVHLTDAISDPFPWLVSFLSKLASPLHPLKELTLHISFQFLGPLLYLSAWKAFSDFILTDPFQKLSKVNFELSMESPISEGYSDVTYGILR